ncbi:MAG: hypothetical protein JXR70_00870, partial [Spirochaetales bacterium]|nr:hypothetical protein [Spirochaetales bacterium]
MILEKPCLSINFIYGRLPQFRAPGCYLRAGFTLKKMIFKLVFGERKLDFYFCICLAYMLSGRYPPPAGRAIRHFAVAP